MIRYASPRIEVEDVEPPELLSVSHPKVQNVQFVVETSDNPWLELEE